MQNLPGTVEIHQTFLSIVNFRKMKLQYYLFQSVTKVSVRD